MSNEKQRITTDRQNIIIYNSPDGKASVALYAKDGTVWMNQKQIAELFATSVPNISIHISNILKEQELEENSVVKDYLTTAPDGKMRLTDMADTETMFRIIQSIPSPKAEPFKRWLA
jgi:hypothetical protein